MLPRHARSALSRLRCNGHSLLLNSYLFRIDRIENLSCSACRHQSQDISHLILQCPATDSLRRSLFVSIRLLVQALGSCPNSGAPWSSTMPSSLGRDRVAPTTTLYPHREMDKNFSPSYSSSQIIYEEAEAIELSLPQKKDRFHILGCVTPHKGVLQKKKKRSSPVSLPFVLIASMLIQSE